MMLWLGNTMFLGGCCLLACPRHKRKVEIDGSTSLLRLLVQFSMLYMAVFKDNQIMFEGHYDLSLKKKCPPVPLDCQLGHLCLIMIQ